MQSQLTRRVFRAILNNEPLSSSQCCNRFLHTLRPYRSRKPPPYNQRRGLFAFNTAPPPAPPAPTLPSEAGLKPMRDLMRSLADKSRGPTTDILTKAFEDFFAARANEPGVITLFQAQLLNLTWMYLRDCEEELEPDDWQKVFSVENVENALYILSETKCLPEAREVVQKVASFAFQELCRDHGFGSDQVNRVALLAYINIQALNGNPEEARSTVRKFWDVLRNTSPSPWLTVMRGFAVSEDRRQLKKIARQFEEHGIRFDPNSQEELATLLMGRGLLTAVKSIYECPLSHGQEPNLSTKIAVIKYAVMKSDTSWAAPIFESLSQEPLAETLGVTLLWDVAHGKSPALVAEKVKALATEAPGIAPSLTISCINDLMRYANTINNPTMVSEFAELASLWDLQPDLQTRLLLLEAYIQAGDVGETIASLEATHDLDITAPENLPLMNKLITMLCSSGQDPAIFDQISAFLDPLFESNARLESDTLAALTGLLLYRHDWEGVSELLRPRLGSCDTAEKAKIRKALTNFILDVDQESAHSWEAYGLLRLAFPETGVAMRTEIMTSFYKRDRGDLAFLVFGHMRQAENFSQRPKPDTYVRCLQGIVRMQDAKNLDLVHNMLKLDVEVDLSTRLLNWLMLAYTASDKPEKSMEIFYDILRSKEGPSHRTISFFFKVCQFHHNGTQEAIKMMDKMKNLDVVVDRRLYMGYIEALAGQCDFDLATDALDAMETVTGHPPTVSSIGLLYNAIPYQYWKDEIEKWAQDRYPDLWARLAEIERTEYEEGLKFKLPGLDAPTEWAKPSTPM